MQEMFKSGSPSGKASRHAVDWCVENIYSTVSKNMTSPGGHVFYTAMLAE
jgi:hypothetical protein